MKLCTMACAMETGNLSPRTRTRRLGYVVVAGTPARACPEPVEGAPAPRCLLRGGGFAFQFGVDGGVGADFVVPALSPELN